MSLSFSTQTSVNFCRSTGRGEGDDYEGVGWGGRVDQPYSAVGLVISDSKPYELKVAAVCVSRTVLRHS